MTLRPAPDDDGDWIEALRGRPPAGAEPRTLEEAGRIRSALRKQPTDEGEPETGLDALLFRLRREGLLETRARPRPTVWYALAASLAVAAIALPLTLGLLRDAAPPDEPPLTRGLPPPAQVLHAGNPAEASRELAADLRAIGAQVEAVGDGPHLRLRIEIPAERRAAAADILARAGLTLPPPGQPLRVEFRPPPSTP
jgi:hypothetical protein